MSSLSILIESFGDEEDVKKSGQVEFLMNLGDVKLVILVENTQVFGNAWIKMRSLKNSDTEQHTLGGLMDVLFSVLEE